MKKNNIWKAWIATAAIIAVTTVGGLTAYFTDTQEKINHFTVGKVKIELKEPEWEKKPDGDKNEIPDEAEHMTPLQRITKDPQVKNTGINDAYIFMTVEIPCREIITVNGDGMKNPRALTPLYSYEKDASWKYMGSYRVLDQEKKQTGIKHLYAYAEESGKCRTVKPNETTIALFKNVLFVNAMEGQGLEEQPFTMNIQAYGIQTMNLNGGTTDAQQIWQIITNQKDIAENYQI